MSVDACVRTEARRTPEPHRPLAGIQVSAAGGSTALAVAAAHLALLGCQPATAGPEHGTGDSRPGHGTGDAGDAGTLVAVTGADSLTCAIDWAGPVALPLASEADVQSACGIAHIHGRRYGEPTPLGLDYAGTVAGVLAVTGMLAAFHAAARGTRIGRVRTSVAQGALLATGQYLAMASAARTHPADRPVPLRSPGPGAGAPPFTSADGVRFEIETLDAEAWQRFWTVLDAERTAIRRGWQPFQNRFATAVCPLPAALHRVTARRSYQVIRSVAARTDVSVLPVPGPDAPEPGDLPETPWTVRALPADRRTAAGPSVPSPAAASPTVSRPLAGLVVVESTGRVQGPLAGHVLARLGARVVKVEPPGGDPLRGIEPLVGGCSARFLAFNHGKDVVEANLRTPSGRGTLRELVRDADVFLHNWAPGKAAAWHLDATDLAGVRPGLVYARASGWGEALGPTPPLGTDYLVQAGSGLAGLTARHGEPPTPSLMTLLDVLGGLVCAEGVLAALAARSTGGRDRHGSAPLLRVDTSLLSAATVLTRHGSGAAPSRRPGPSVPLTSDLTALAADPRFGAALTRAGCVLPGTPWEFTA
ncbi:CoA transferase [Streptomyces sp. NPDC091412]|uniref:CoA transferase n=1 Tax=Streptomyces sp. NPDC091412 TaxID=3366002 RepID=UPI0038283E53